MSNNKKPNIVSLSGAPIYYHNKFKVREATRGKEFRGRISDHIEEYLGSVAGGMDDPFAGSAHINTHVTGRMRNIPLLG